MSKKLFAFITGLIGVACTVVTICMNYFEPSCADKVRTICTMVPPFAADILMIFVVTDAANKVEEKK